MKFRRDFAELFRFVNLAGFPELSPLFPVRSPVRRAAEAPDCAALSSRQLKSARLPRKTAARILSREDVVRGAVRVDLLEDRLPEVLVELRAARLERRRQELLLLPVRAVHLRGTHRRNSGKF